MENLINSLKERSVFVNFEIPSFKSFGRKKNAAPPDMPTDSVAFIDVVGNQDNVEEQLKEEECATLRLLFVLTNKTFSRKMARVLIEEVLLPFKSVIKEHPRKREFDIQMFIFNNDLGDFTLKSVHDIAPKPTETKSAITPKSKASTKATHAPLKAKITTPEVPATDGSSVAPEARPESPLNFLHRSSLEDVLSPAECGLKVGTEADV